MQDVNDIFKIFSADITVEDVCQDESYMDRNLNKSRFVRTTSFLQHPVFNRHHSETRIVRYMKSLENKDVSLVHSMIPLVNCLYILALITINGIIIFITVSIGIVYNEIEFHHRNDAL